LNRFGTNDKYSSVELKLTCPKYAAKTEGLRVLEDHIYADEAISGSTDDRAGLRRLLAAAQQKPRPLT
jgi:DNA invertase Pin-like site-specific DNA recombinase